MSIIPRLSGCGSLLLAAGGVMTLLPSVSTAAELSAEAASLTTSKGVTTFQARVQSPPEFAPMEGARELSMDLYSGGSPLGEVRVILDGNEVRFVDPGAVTRRIPRVRNPASIENALKGALESHAELVCGVLNDKACGTVQTDSVAVIVNESRLRIDLFVGPELLLPVLPGPTGYLDDPDGSFSVTSGFGLSLSGTAGNSALYQLQSRNIIGLGAARLRTNVAVASGFGLVVDDMVAELDRPDQRYSAGLFWAPGNDFTGERRILGAAFETQLDTRADRERLQDTPQYLFLRQPARVELLVDGRLTGSRYYEAGNNVLDTSSLPSGAYDVTLRIQEGNGPVREERRFFVRNATMAPMGRPIFHAAAGLVSRSTRSHLLHVSEQLYYSAGVRVRLTDKIGTEASFTGTGHKVLGQIGLAVATPWFFMRGAALQSSGNDRGGFLQLTSGNLGSLRFAFDLRRIHSGSGQPLLPQADVSQSFDGPKVNGEPSSLGSYTQIGGNVSLQLGSVDLQLRGYFRKDPLSQDYGIGPSAEWQAVSRSGVQLSMLADMQRTALGTSGSVSMRLLISRGRLSTITSSGASFSRGASATGASVTGSLGAQTELYPSEDGRLALTGNINKEAGGSRLQGSGNFSSSLGNARLDLGRSSGSKVQYSFSVQSGTAISGAALALGGKELRESALLVTTRGTQGVFELLIDGSPVGRLSAGTNRPIFLSPYRSYSVQLRPLAGSAVSLDPAPRRITLYPGSVAHAVWEAQRVVTIFGKVVGADGKPIQGLRSESGNGEMIIEEDGWFQTDLRALSSIKFVGPGDLRCEIPAPALKAEQDHVSVGVVTCQ